MSASSETNMTAKMAGVWERQWEEDPLGCEQDKIDRSTIVVWTQTPCGVYVDLRLPVGAPGREVSGQCKKRPTSILGIDGGNYTEKETSLILQTKSFAGRLECLLGDTTTGGQALKNDEILAEMAKANEGPLPLCTCVWQREIDYQPPSGSLDVGVFASSPQNEDGTLDLRETGDDASYAEGWRRMAGTSDGPFVALELESENGKPRRGFWVRAGNRFAYAVGRQEDGDMGSKVKECKGMSLSEAISSLDLDSNQQKTKVALSYVAALGEVEKDGSWRIDASTSEELVGCALIQGDTTQHGDCCSTLSMAPEGDVAEGALLEQVIATLEGNKVRRTWKMVELSSPSALALNEKKLNK